MVPCQAGSEPTLLPSANKQLDILDRYLQPVPVGVPSELHISGVGLARGYLNFTEKTAADFTDCGFPILDFELETDSQLTTRNSFPNLFVCTKQVT